MKSKFFIPIYIFFTLFIQIVYATNWVKTNQLPPENAKDITKIYPLNDGLLVLAKTNGGLPNVLFKLDNNGTLIKSQIITEEMMPYVSLVGNNIDIVVKPNQTISLLGQVNYTNPKLYITNLNSNFDILQKDTFNLVNGFRRVDKALPTADNGFMLGTFDNVLDSARYVFYKFDQNNDTLWSRLIKIPEQVLRVPRLKIAGISNDNGKSYHTLVAFNVFYPDFLTSLGNISLLFINESGNLQNRILTNFNSILDGNPFIPVLIDIKANQNGYNIYLSNVEENTPYVRLYKCVFDNNNNLISSNSFRNDLTFNQIAQTDAINEQGYVLSAGFRHLFLSNDIGQDKVEILPLDNVKDKVIQFTKAVTVDDNSWMVCGYVATNGSNEFQDIFLHIDAPSGLLEGKSFFDKNINCIFNGNEDNFPNLPIKLDGVLNLYTTTDSLGNYKFPVFVGNYLLSPIMPSPYWKLCDQTQNISISAENTTFNIPIQPIADCPLLSVDISTPYLEKCKDNTYSILYKNEGSSTAFNAFVDIEIDPALNWVNSELPNASIGNNKYRIQLGNIEPLTKGETKFIVNVDCFRALDEQTHCVFAHIFPDTICLEPESCNDSSFIVITSECVGDSIVLKIKNIGSGPSTRPRPLLILEEDIMRIFTDSINLLSGDSMIVIIPSNGNTFKFITSPNSCNYYSNTPSSVIEACGGINNTGFVNILPQDDNSPAIAISCITNINSAPIAQIYTQPTGYGQNHYISDSTRIDYMIAFVNTGNNIANTISIIDTLDPNFDWNSFELTTSSHDVTLEKYNNGILNFIFEDINLEPYHASAEFSYGFVKFSLLPKKDITSGATLRQSANIYFDNNLPYITNEVWHTIGEDFISIIASNTNTNLNILANIYPNPSSKSVNIELKENDLSNTLLKIYSINGNTILTLPLMSNNTWVDLNEFQNGIYLFSIEKNNKNIHQGKIIVHH